MPSKSLSDELRSEISKWSARLEKRLSSVAPADATGAAMLENARAYFSDSAHFLARSDLVRSFECLIWGWAFLEIGLQLGHLRESEPVTR
jgi:hypothetical protein